MKTVMGNPDPKHVSTSFVERQNLSMRMGIRRFTCLTNAFSKKVENHTASVVIWFMYYNFCRVHSTLRVTSSGSWPRRSRVGHGRIGGAASRTETGKARPLQEASSKCGLISGNGERIEIPPSSSGNGRTKSNRDTPLCPQSFELLRKTVLKPALPQKASADAARSKNSS